MSSDIDRIREVNDAIQLADVQAVSEALHPEVVWEHNLGGGMVRDGKVMRGKVYLDPEEALASVE